jgi:hypothetical protein
MLYGIAKNSAELYGIPCQGMLLNSVEFRNSFVSAELRTISGNFNFFVFLNFNRSIMPTIPTSIFYSILYSILYIPPNNSIFLGKSLKNRVIWL